MHAITKVSFSGLAGWTEDLIFHPSLSGEKYGFAYLLFLPGYPESTDSPDFVSDTIHDDLHKAEQILLVFYDEENQIAQQLQFKGNNHVWSWFNVKNIVRSSHWEFQKFYSFDSFSINPDLFNMKIEITKNKNVNNCESVGFFNLMCHNSTESCQYGSSTEAVCGIRYSSFKYPVAYSEASLASKFKVLTKRSKNFEYQLVFLLEAFSGVTPDLYFKSGLYSETSEPRVIYPARVFRHELIISNIRYAKFIKYQIYNLEQTKVVSEVIFRGSSGSYRNWLASKYIKFSSLWNINKTNFATEIDRFELREAMFGSDSFNCETWRGWVIVIDFYYFKCPQQKWRNGFLSLVATGEISHSQPPVILYSNSSEAQPVALLQIGGRIELSVS